MASRLRVLVVDDDQLTLEMIGTVLATEGVEVLGFGDAREAAALIDQEAFDGIFLDLTMPGLSGLELAKRIRESAHNARTPIVVITGRGDAGDAMKEAFAAGSHFFLSKPLDLAKLRHLVHSIHGTLLRERNRGRQVLMGVQLACRSGRRQFTGVSSRISEQSLVFCLLFVEEKALRPGEFVHVSFHLPISLWPVEAMCEVARIDGRQHICHFQKLNPETRKAVREYVALFPEDSPAPPTAEKAVAA
jgi:CheY-like chemotaxis protein